MKKLLLLFTITALLFACQSGEKSAETAATQQHTSELNITWSYDVTYPHEWDPALPISAITVKINDTEYLVLEGVQGEFYELEKAEYQAWNIPESAFSASIGGWGGLIRVIYIEKKDNELVITQGFEDAESGVDGLVDVEMIQTIRFSE